MWVYRLRRLARLPTPELVLLLQAQWALLRTWARLRFQSPGRIVSAASESPATPATEVDTAELDRARAVEQAIMRAARHGLVRPLCLARSLALQSMLEARQIGGSRVRVGVQLEDGEFTAHAWVEYCGLVLGDTRTHVNGYVPLDRARVRASR